MTIRDKPSLDGKKIGGFPYNAQIVIVAKTAATLTLQDNGNTIQGNWVKVEYTHAKEFETGYVFDGFLQEK